MDIDEDLMSRKTSLRNFPRNFDINQKEPADAVCGGGRGSANNERRGIQE